MIGLNKIVIPKTGGGGFTPHANDGKYIYIASRNRYYYSQNYGASWSNRTFYSQGTKTQITCSEDGSEAMVFPYGSTQYRQIIYNYGGSRVSKSPKVQSYGGFLARSGTFWAMNSGSTMYYANTNANSSSYSTRALPELCSYYMAGSYDGSVLYVGDVGKIYQSLDYGVNWNTITSPAASDRRLSCCYEGKHILVRSNTDFIHVSNDFGANWNSIAITNGTYTNSEVSATGQYMLTRDLTDGFLLSTDYGATFSQLGVVAWEGTMSPSGQYIYLFDGTTQWTSTDFGQSFSSKAFTRSDGYTYYDITSS